MTSKLKTDNKDQLATKIATALLKIQNFISSAVNKRFESMTGKKVKMLLIGFCVVSGGLSGYFLVNALVAKPKPAIKIDQVRMPKHFDKAGDEIMENTIPDDIYLQIQDYKKYMDSIGQPIRPGLLDSMKILEELYLSQQK